VLRVRELELVGWTLMEETDVSVARVGAMRQQDGLTHDRYPDTGSDCEPGSNLSGKPRCGAA
jgi:hypothetical protein